MEPFKLAKQMIDFNKATFDNSFNAIAMLHEQMEKTQNTFLEQASWLPQEGRKALCEWVTTCRKGRENFKTVVDDSFKKVESYFANASGCNA